MTRTQLISWIPPVVLERIALWRGKALRFEGPYSSWEEAVQDARGYGDQTILDRVRTATRKVVSGVARWERDGITFSEPAYPFPLIAILLKAALAENGRLNVLDFGGALGSSYFQCRDFLSDTKVKWSIVEQAHFVDCGRQEFASNELQFHYSIDECLREQRPNVVLISGVLQYLQEPLPVLRSLAAASSHYLIIDRTPFAVDGQQQIVVQMNRGLFNDSSYPSWSFDGTLTEEPLRQGYEVVSQFDAIDGVLGQGRLKSRYRGLVFRLKSAPT